MMPRRAQPPAVVAVLVGALVVGVGVTPVVAEQGPAPRGAIEVSGATVIDPRSLGAGPVDPARALALSGGVRARAVRDLPAASEDLASDSTASGDVGTASVPAGLSILHTRPNFQGFDATGAMIGGKVVYGTENYIRADTHPPDPYAGLGGWENADFFNLPSSHWYWGSTVSSSIYQGRWVAALPSFIGPAGGCTTGFLNVAVSTTNDPLKPWLVYRLSIGDAWTDQIRIGVSDNKVVLATNRWDLDSGQPDCLGAPYEGARLRVLDWADLLDGGTVTAQELSIASATSYWNWVPATNVPSVSSTTAGAPVYVVGDKNVGGWGNVVFGAITGSAKAGTAVLSRNEDMTASGKVSKLTFPPDAIAAFSSGNGFQDERIVSASYRAGRLWFSSTGSCLPQGDATIRACARYVQINTAATPATQVDSAYFAEAERDTFLPLVGFSRDGAAFFTMAASSAVAHEPIDELATFRAPGQALVGGADEVRIWAGEEPFIDLYLGSTGSVSAVPNDAGAVLALYEAAADGRNATPWITQIRGGQTGDPGGTIAKVNTGTGWVNLDQGVLVVRPSTTSPIELMRISASPEVESTAGGNRLVHGRDLPPLASILFVADDPELGGGPVDTSWTAYVQFRTWDGTWSNPISKTVQVDATLPTITPPRFIFLAGAIGLKAPVRVAWTASDDLSGLAKVHYQEERGEPTPLSFIKNLSATATSIDRSFNLSSSYQWWVGVTAWDRADNPSFAGAATVKFGAPAGGTGFAFVKTWSTQSSTSFLGGSTRYATAAGATVTYTTTARSLAFVTTKGPNRGKAEIWVDGVKKATVDLYSSTTKYRQMVYQAAWTAKGSHTIMVKVLGTSGRPRIDFDAFLRAY